MRIWGYGWVLCVLAATLPLSAQAVAPVNSVNNGPVIHSGTYPNTPDGKTTFINSVGGGLWLKSGSNIRGVEVDSAGHLTNNGGTVHLYAPRDVVRLDGNIDVRGIRNNNGVYLGNGGNVFVDSAYLYQSGNIYANGVNGGLVQFNVGAATLTGTARIEAKGTSTGHGGVIAMNASGAVDLGKKTLLDSSGKVMGSFDANVINIEGGLVNASGVIQANGMDSRGGTIRMVSTGQTDLNRPQEALFRAVTAGNFTESESNTLKTRLANLKTAHDGDIVITAASSEGTQANIFANGHPGRALEFTFPPLTGNSGNDPSGLSERAGDGGTIIMAAARNIENGGWILANGGSGYPYRGDTSDPGSFIHGGHGGTISLTAQQNITNTGRIVSDGGIGGLSIDRSVGRSGGSAGLIAFSYGNQMQNSGVIRAIGGEGATIFSEFPTPNQGAGGNGGLVVFSGNGNPGGNGVVVTYGGLEGGPGGSRGALGSVVVPNPVTSTNTLIGVWRKTQPVELLTHAENLLLLTKGGGTTQVQENIFQRMLQATIRSVEDPSGTLGQARTEVISKNTGTSAYVFRNLILGSSQNGLALALDHPHRQEAPGADSEFILPSPLSNAQAFTTLNTLTVVNNGSVSTQYFPGPYSDSPATQTDFWLIGRNSNNLGGGRISLLANGDFNNRNTFGTVGMLSGGSIHIAATGNINNDVIGYGGDVLSTSGMLHGGSIIEKAGQDINHNRVNYFDQSVISANGGQIGGSIFLGAQRNFTDYADSYASRISANGNLQGGIINIRAGNNSTLEPPDISAPGSITANGTSTTLGRGGFIQIHADNLNTHNGGSLVEANGAAANGTVLFTSGH